MTTADQTNFVGRTGIEIDEASPDRCIGRIELTPSHHQPHGLVHGGVYCTLIETLASTGAALWAVEHGKSGVVGVSNTTDFLRATRNGVLIGEATPIYQGRSQQLWQVVVTRDEDRKLAARGQVRLHNVSTTDL